MEMRITQQKLIWLRILNSRNLVQGGNSLMKLILQINNRRVFKCAVKQQKLDNASLVQRQAGEKTESG